MKYKAHQTYCLMLFALDRLMHCPTATHCEDLVRAGEAMVEFMDTIKAAPMRVPEQTCQRLYELMMIHLVRSGAAGLSFVPKHHFYMHLTDRTGRVPIFVLRVWGVSLTPTPPPRDYASQCGMAA
eukprot:249055-Pyramimonas_sp.AAC.1